MTRQLSRQSISLLMRRPMVRIHHGSPFCCCIILAPSSNGQDSWFSSMPQEFESPRGHHLTHETFRSISSVGRALPLQGRCHKFESYIDHHYFKMCGCSLVWLERLPVTQEVASSSLVSRAIYFISLNFIHYFIFITSYCIF